MIPMFQRSMEAAWTSETLVSYYNSEDLYLKLHHHESLKTRVVRRTLLVRAIYETDFVLPHGLRMSHGCKNLITY
jgi:hypothetical protein